MKTIITCLLLIHSLIFNFSAFGESKTPTILLAFHDRGFPPYTINDPQNKGIMIDVISTISNKLGYKLIIEALPRKRADIYLKNGKINCMPSSRDWMENSNQYLWSDSVLTSKDIIIFQKGHFSEINSLKGIQQSKIKTVGTILGYNYPTFEPLFLSKKITRQDVISTRALLKVLQLGRVDAAISNKFVTQWVINNDPSLSHNMFQYGPVIAKAEYCFCFVKNDIWLTFLNKFNRELAKMKKNGALQKIIDNYLK